MAVWRRTRHATPDASVGVFVDEHRAVRRADDDRRRFRNRVRQRDELEIAVDAPVDPALFQEPAEGGLYESFQAVKVSVEARVAGGAWLDALTETAGLRVAPIYGGQDYLVQFRQLDRGVHVIAEKPLALDAAEADAIVAAARRAGRLVGVDMHKRYDPDHLRIRDDLAARFPVGTKLRILPNHACATGAQFPEYHAVSSRGGVEVWGRFHGW